MLGAVWKSALIKNTAVMTRIDKIYNVRGALLLKKRKKEEIIIIIIITAGGRSCALVLPSRGGCLCHRPNPGLGGLQQPLQGWGGPGGLCCNAKRLGWRWELKSYTSIKQELSSARQEGCGVCSGEAQPPPRFLGLRPGAPLVPFKGVAALQQLSPTTPRPSCRLAGRAIGAKEHPHAPQQQPHPMGTQPHGCTRVRVRVPRPPGSQPGLQDTGLWWWVCVWGGNSSPQGLVYQPPRTQP